MGHFIAIPLVHFQAATADMFAYTHPKVHIRPEFSPVCIRPGRESDELHLRTALF